MEYKKCRQSAKRVILTYFLSKGKETELECGPVPNVMATLPNIGGALCSTPQSLADAAIECHAVTLPRREAR